MKIILAHYHLRPGGGSSVVLHEARSLMEAGDEILVMSGEEPAALSE